MTTLIASILPYAATVVAVIAGVIGIFVAGKRSGANQVERELEQEGRKAREKAREASAQIDRLDDDAVRGRARERLRNAARR